MPSTDFSEAPAWKERMTEERAPHLVRVASVNVPFRRFTTTLSLSPVIAAERHEPARRT